jgi:hypothetical protein
MIREQIDAMLHGAPYDIAEDTLVVWPAEGYETEVVYRLTAGRVLRPQVRERLSVRAAEAAAVGAAAMPELNAGAILFRSTPISWSD